MGMLKCGKTPGLDGVPAELIRNSGPASIRVLLKLCTQIWNSLNWPDAWKKQEIVMIHKSGKHQRMYELPNHYHPQSCKQSPSHRNTEADESQDRARAPR